MISRRLSLGSLFGLAAAALAWQSNNQARAQKTKGRVLRHLVLYKFKDTCTPAEVQEVIDTFAGLPKQIDTIISFECGPNVSTEGKSDGLTQAFLVTFRDEAGRDVYLKHPAHDAYVNVVRSRRERVIVFDYWADA